MEKILDNVDLLILSAAFVSLIATVVMFKRSRNQELSHPKFGHMTGPPLLLVGYTCSVRDTNLRQRCSRPGSLGRLGLPR